MTVEDGTGVVGANAYVNLQYANDYCEARGIAPWASASTPEKEAAIVRATEWLDGRWVWKGLRKTVAQGLEWPRTDAYDAAGNELTGVPSALKRATVEAAVRSLSAELSPDQTSGAVVEQTVGPITTKYASPNAEPSYPGVSRILRELIAGGTSGVRLSR